MQITIKVEIKTDPGESPPIISPAMKSAALGICNKTGAEIAQILRLPEIKPKVTINL
jgi:hypothetical protein